jgi:aldehyde oxidoreductase
MQQLSRMQLNINGVDRYVLYDPQRDSLATVLRRLGLTGTKIGCDQGVCGACSVLLNGKVIRSCTRKMKNVAANSQIITIEGIGSPQHLHPLQQAWITYGGVQCGFCSPGFIVSAYGLLLENPNPTREEVRDWFTTHRNICRCTGYKQLVDAVMAAALVMRGEASIEDISHIDEPGTPIYGSNHPRPAALAKVTGLCDYGDDISLKMPDNTVHLALVLSEVAHANILGIDITEAEKMPGVYKILLAADVKGTNVLGSPSKSKRSLGTGHTKMAVIADKKINKRGDCVAVVAADTREHARAAAQKVKVNIQRLPEYMNALDAVAPDAIQIFDDMPNLHGFQPTLMGKDTAQVIEESPYVVEGSFQTQHEPHLPIEPDVVNGYWDEDGMLTIQCKSQAVGQARNAVAAACGLPADKVRIIINPTGGSFGYSVFTGSYAIVGAAVMALGRPCTLTMSYDEHQHYTGKRTASYSNGRLACDETGKITAAEIDIAIDHGAYAMLGDGLLHSCAKMGFHGYYVPNVKILARLVTSNHGHGVAYRGYGAPQVYTCSESLMDMMAEKLGMDPFEFRYINLAQPGQNGITSAPYREYPMQQIMDAARPYYYAMKEEAAKARAEGRYCGVGVGFGGYNVGIGIFDTAEVALELNPDGTINHYNTWEDMGQGGDIGTLTLTVKALEPLNIKPEQVKLVMGDTKICPDTGIAAASRSHYMAGFATQNAAKQLLDAMRKPDGSYRTYAEMLAEGIPTKYIGRHDVKGEGLTEPDPNTGACDKTPTYMYCVNLAQVEVDVNTGKTKVTRMVVVSDTGVIANKLSVDGQAYGGLSHCIGYALSEDYQEGQKDYSILACGVPSCKDIPDDIKLIHIENPRVNGPYGSSGCSENFQASGHMAVINAIANATGARIYELAAKPEKVKAALEKMARGEDLRPRKYYLGSDFEEEIETIMRNPV